MVGRSILRRAESIMTYFLAGSKESFGLRPVQAVPAPNAATYLQRGIRRSYSAHGEPAGAVPAQSLRLHTGPADALLLVSKALLLNMTWLCLAQVYRLQ